MATAQPIFAFGTRKHARAQVRLKKGTGKIVVNGRKIEDYFFLTRLQKRAVEPLACVEKQSQFDIEVVAKGGGPTGQADAVRLGIARGLVASDKALREQLRKAGFLTRDSRMVERKKYGQKGARAKYTWVKR